MSTPKSPVPLRLQIEADTKQFKGLDSAFASTEKHVDDLTASLQLLSKFKADVHLAAAAAKAQDLGVKVTKTSYAIKQGFGTLLPQAIKHTEQEIDQTGLALVRRVFKPVDSFFDRMQSKYPKIAEVVAKSVSEIDTAPERERSAPIGKKVLTSVKSGISQGKLLLGDTQLRDVASVAQGVLGVTDQIVNLRQQLAPLTGNLLAMAKAAVIAGGGGVGGIAKLAGSLAGLGVAGVVAGAAVVAVTVGVATVLKQLTDMGHKLSTILGVQQDIITVQVNGTVQDAKDRIKEAEVSNKAAQALRDQNLRLIEGLGGFDAAYRLSALPGDLGGPIRQLLDDYAKYNDQVLANSTIIGQLTTSLNDGTIAANDSAKAEQELADKRKRVAEELDKFNATQVEKTAARNLERAQFLATASADDVRARIKNLTDDVNTNQETVAELDRNNSALALGLGGPEEQAAYNNLKQQIRDAKNEIYFYSQGVIEAKEATEAGSKASQSAVDALSQRTQADLDYQQALKDGNAEEKKVQAEKLRAEQAAREAEIASIKEQIGNIDFGTLSVTDAEAALKPFNDRLAELQKEADKAAPELAEVNREIAGLAGKNLSEAFKDPLKFIKNLIDSTTGINVDAVGTNIQARIDKRNQDISDAYSKYKEDIKGIEESSLKQRLDLQKRYSTALVDAAKQAVEAANQALENLKQQQAELAKDFAKGERDVEKQARKAQLKEQIQVQREDRDALVAHLRDLETIRRNAQRQERDLIQNRDFAALFNLREDTANQIEDSQRTFNEQQGDKIHQRAEERADQLQAYAEERADRLAAYVERQADLQASYQQELVTIEQQRIKAITQAKIDRDEALRQEYLDRKQQLKVRKAALDNELKLLADFGVEAGKIMARKMKEALDYLNSITPGGKGKAPVSIGGIKSRAGGGPLSAGDLSWVNDPLGNQESYNGVPFPPGLGLFMPAVGGNVTNSKSMGNVSLSFNIQAARQPEATATAIERQVRIVLDKVLS